MNNEKDEPRERKIGFYAWEVVGFGNYGPMALECKDEPCKTCGSIRYFVIGGLGSGGFGGYRCASCGTNLYDLSGNE